MEIDDKTIDFLEKSFPEMAIGGTNGAYWETLASGNNVTIAKNGQIVEVSPDGSIKVIKESKPMIQMEKGKIIELR